jgi:hypothetical protein
MGMIIWLFLLRMGYLLGIKVGSECFSPCCMREAVLVNAIAGVSVSCTIYLFLERFRGLLGGCSSRCLCCRVEGRVGG